MDVLILGAGRPATGLSPSALKSVGLSSRALDWQIQGFRKAVPNVTVHYLGGYQVSAVIAAYPELRYTVVPNWESHGPFHTLLSAPALEGPVLVSYGDTIFGADNLQAFAATDADVVIGIDSQWRSRYEHRSAMDIESAERITPEQFRDLVSVDSEFTGLIKFSSDAWRWVRRLDSGRVGESLLELLKHLDTHADFDLSTFDFGGRWAEFNSPEDVTRFVLGTKAETLTRLQPLVCKSTIGSQVTFTTDDWQHSPDACLRAIKDEFGDSRLVVRSSTRREDGWVESNAGGFESRLDVNGMDTAELSCAIAGVIESYGIQDIGDDQILVQAFVSDVRAGVVFTCDLETGAPYYRLSFDDSKASTEAVTSGQSEGLRTLVVHRDRVELVAKLEPTMLPVLLAVKELEELLAFDKLDVEFAVTDEHDVHIFQVRPIAVDHASYELDYRLHADLVAACATYFEREQVPRPHTVGQSTMFGNMPDWNPAEIVGTRPRPLAFSLYRELITNDIWAEQRAEFGYRDIRPHPLICGFAGQPYVNLRASFNSFVPAAVPDVLAAKLVESYLDLLRANPELHDKIEFDVAFTVWTPDFWQQATQRFSRYGITDAELKVFSEALKKVTLDAIGRMRNEQTSLEEMHRRRSLLATRELAALEYAHALIYDCKQHGTKAFAHAARLGFVAATFLRSFVSLDVLAESRVEEFMESVRTVSKSFEAAKRQVAQGESDMSELIGEFGHLRPGTYEITAPAYWEDPASYLKVAGAHQPTTAEFTLTDQETLKIAHAMRELGADLEPVLLMNLFRRAIEYREAVKFEFTRNLSLALDKIAASGETLRVTREDLAYLTLEDLKDVSLNLVTKQTLNHKVAYNKQLSVLSELTLMPTLIRNAEDFYCFEQLGSQPNYITHAAVEAKVYEIGTGPPSAALADVAGNIVLIPQADPGYDWLFSMGIAGLVTMFGGANSHMAIRAAEQGLPAVIGLGEKKYAEVKTYRSARLDCANQTILRLS